MGRGRQKAKHQKVARELKYHTSDIDILALKHELSIGDEVDRAFSDQYGDSADDDDDPYGSYADPDDDDDG